MNTELLACPDCNSRNLKTFASAPDRRSRTGGVLLALKCQNCQSVFTLTVEPSEVTKTVIPAPLPPHGFENLLFQLPEFAK